MLVSGFVQSVKPQSTQTRGYQTTCYYTLYVNSLELYYESMTVWTEAISPPSQHLESGLDTTRARAQTATLTESFNYRHERLCNVRVTLDSNVHHLQKNSDEEHSMS